MKRYYRKPRGLMIIAIVALIAILGTSGGLLIRHFLNSKKQKENIYYVPIINTDVKMGDSVEGNISLVEFGPDAYKLAMDNVIFDVTSGVFKMDLSKGTIATNDLIAKKCDVGDDVRLHNFPYVELSDKIIPGDYVDVRVSFNDGTDYVLLSKKKVYDCSVYDPGMQIDNSLWMEIDEEEILRMSSAAVDAANKEDCRLYAIKYISQSQKEAVITYPVNKLVAALIEKDPNIATAASAVLEGNLRDQIDASIGDKQANEKTGESSKNESTTSKGENDDKNTPSNDDIVFNDGNDDSLVYESGEDKNIQFLD